MATEHPAPHGSARFATENELFERFPLSAARNRTGAVVAANHLEFSGEGHLMTFAPTRSGKGTRFLVPSLLRNTAFSHDVLHEIGAGRRDLQRPCSLYSSVVIDPKGENAFMMPGTPAVPYLVFNPWGVLGLPSTPINPLDVLDPESDAVRGNARQIANILVPYEAESKKYFIDRARDLVTLIILHLVFQKPAFMRTVPQIYAHLCQRSGDFQDMLEEAAEHEELARLANDMLGDMESGSDPWNSYLSTAKQNLSIFDEKLLRQALRTPPDHVREYYQNLATSWMARRVYVVIPGDKLGDYYKLTRLIVASLMLMVVNNPGRRVVFYFDEFPRLGRLSIVKEAFTTYTGLGIICWPFIQTLGDLKDVYPGSWETFLSNAHTTHYSAVNDLTTARMVSELAGKQTIYTSNESTSQSQSTNRTKGQSWGRSQSRTEGSSRSSTSGSSVGGSIQHPLFGDERKLRESWGRSWSETTGSSQSRTQGQSSSENESRSVGESTQQGQGRSETGRPLLFPDELRSLDKSEVLMFNAGMRPAWLKVPAYYEPESRFASAAFKRYLRPNPFVFPEVQPANQLEESKEASTIALQRLKLNPADVVQELIRRDDI